MSELSQSDLILAGSYIDGELSDEQCAAVKSRLETDTKFAEAVAELQQQSSLLKRLPKFRPSEDLSGQTLQASIDQVQAIMGKWPFESELNEDGKVSLEVSDVGESFNWRSFAALAATLAGVLFLGAMLWPKQDLGTNVAMSSESGVARPSNEKATTTPDLVVVDSDAVDSEVSSVEEELAMKSPPPMRSKASRSDLVQGLPPMKGGFSGTRMRVGKQQDSSAGSAVPVEQVWFVNQPGETPDVAAINKVLASNSIAVKPATGSMGSGLDSVAADNPQKQLAEKEVRDSASDVEAFYVAATPGQMKLALTELSNNADVSMFEVPQNGFQIAAAVEQQFQDLVPTPAPTAEIEQQAVPEPALNVQIGSVPNRIVPPGDKNALAQQLVNSSLPRSMPAGPVPPILESGMDFASGAGIGQSSTRKTAASGMASESDQPAQPKIAKAGPVEKANPAKNMNLADNVRPSAPVNSAARTLLPSRNAPSPAPSQSGFGTGVGESNSQQSRGAITDSKSAAYFDRHLDDSDKQLRQYLILIRGDASAKALPNASPAMAPGQR